VLLRNHPAGRLLRVCRDAGPAVQPTFRSASASPKRVKFQKSIDTLGGLEALKHRPFRLEVPGFMRLVIEHVGAGPRGGELVSVAHYGEQNVRRVTASLILVIQGKTQKAGGRNKNRIRSRVEGDIPPSLLSGV
jgi:hypothetical protein